MAQAILSNNTLGLGNLSSIDNWADAVDQESKLLKGDEPHKRTEVIKDGIKTVVDYVLNEAHELQRVVTSYKVITKKVPRAISERKKWTKFGGSVNDGPGPQAYTTSVSEEIKINFIRSRSGELPDQDLDFNKLDSSKTVASKGHCRICKADDHWSVMCPYKEMYQNNEDEAETADNKARQNTAGGASTGRYVNPHARGDARGLTLNSTGERRSDDFTCRVTNLPEDSETLDDDLRSMFNSVGRIERFFLAKDKTTSKAKGFAFITFTNREDTEKAIKRFNGSKMEHLILKVEWTRKE